MVQIPPLGIFETVTDAPLPYFIALTAPALNGQSSQILNEIADVPNSTFFTVNNANVTSRILQSTTPQEILQYSEYTFIPGHILYSIDLGNGSSWETALGKNLTITTYGGDIWVNDAKIIRKDILISNGVMHVIDQVRVCTRRLD